jgi:putative hydrolase of the HAD superfamily
MIEVVFFDAGETLLHPEPSWSERTLQILGERGHPVTLDEIRGAWLHGGQHFVNAAEEGFVFAASHTDSHFFWTSLYHDMLDHLGIDDHEAADVLYETFSDPANYVLFDDAVPTVTALKERGLRLGIISNFEGWLAKLLDHLQIRNLFDIVAISGDLAIEKPDPRIFRWAMEEAGASPERSLHVGDSPNFDAQPAHDLGMVGVLLDRHGRWGDLHAPYPVVPTLTALLDLV